MNNMPLVYIIVLNWNGKEHLDACFSSLGKLDYPNVRIVMVDNGSTDGSVAFVDQKFPHVAIIPLSHNIGFAAGNNAGIGHALNNGAHYIALLNNDTVVHPRWIAELVAAAEADPNLAVCATKMLYQSKPDVINGIGVVMNRLCYCWDHHNGEPADSVAASQEVLAASGGAFFARTSCLKEVGIFDPAYFIYMEDVDLCIRIRSRGYSIRTVPSAIVFHKYSATMVGGSPLKNYFVLKNRLRILLKLFPAGMVRYALPGMLKEELLRTGRQLRWREPAMALSQLRAFAITLAQAGNILRQRHEIQNSTYQFPTEFIHPSTRPPKIQLPPASCSIG